MHEELRRAMAPVMVDVRAAGGPVPVVRDEAWTDNPSLATAILDSPKWSTGVGLMLSAPDASAVVALADQLQKWVIEELWCEAAPTNWPPCPHHAESHPLTAAVRDGAAMWACPTDGTAFTIVGGLTAVS